MMQFFSRFSPENARNVVNSFKFEGAPAPPDYHTLFSRNLGMLLLQCFATFSKCFSTKTVLPRSTLFVLSLSLGQGFKLPHYLVPIPLQLDCMICTSPFIIICVLTFLLDGVVINTICNILHSPPPPLRVNEVLKY